MLKDRLNDLDALDVEDDEAQEQSRASRFPRRRKRNSKKFLTEFFDQVKTIRSLLDSIETKVQRVAELHPDILLKYQRDVVAKTDEEIHTLMKDISKESKQIKNFLIAMSQDIQMSRAAVLKRVDEQGMSSENEDALYSTELRVKETQHSTLSRRFFKVMSEYNDVQAANKDKYKEWITRHCKVYDENMSEDQIERVIEHGTEGIFLGHSHDEAFEKLQRINDRHQDLVKLEESLLELHEMFTDMAVLVQQQGEMIDKIEFPVQKASDYTEQAANEISNARKLLRRLRQKKSIITVLLVGLTLIIVLPLVV